MRKFLPIFSGILLASVFFFTFLLSFNGREGVYSSGKTPLSFDLGFIKFKNSAALSKTNVLGTFSSDAFNKNFAELEEKVKTYRGSYGIYIKNLESSKTVSINPNKGFFGASVYKVPVAVTVLKAVESGRINFSTKVEYTPQYFEGGSGSIQNSGFGSKYSVLTLLNKLLKDSDNIAQNMLFSLVPESEINIAFNQLVNQGHYPLSNYGTAKEVGIMLEEIYNFNYLSPENTELLFRILSETAFDDRIHKGLSEDFVFSHKIGNWHYTGTWHDCGIIFGNSPVVVCVMSENTTYEEFVEVSKLVGEFAQQNML